FWVWFLPPSEEAAGWGPHRDRVQCTVDDDNSPQVITVWLAFSDATPLNGCIYVLPTNFDDSFERRVWDNRQTMVLRRPQDIRAVPASKGSLLSWNHGLLHW